MPLSVIGSMLFGGAFLGSYLNDKAYKEAVKENLSRHTLTKREYCEHPVEYIRGEIYEMYEEFSSGLTNDTIIPDMLICYDARYEEESYPEKVNRFFRSEFSGNEYLDTNSYYNWWEKNYNKFTVKIFPEAKNKEDVIKFQREQTQKKLLELAEKHNMYPIYKWNSAFGENPWTKDCPEVLAIKEKTGYNPPKEDMLYTDTIESEYLDYHFNHPVKTWQYLKKDKNPLHKKQIKLIKSYIHDGRLASLKVWKDRLVFESQGLLPTEFVVVDYFLRWCRRNKVEIYEQEMKALFCVLTSQDNPVNYAVDYLKEYNKMNIEEQYRLYNDNHTYLYKLGEKYGFSKEFDATYDHFEEGTPLPANRNMNINIPNKRELEEFDKQAIPQAVPRAPAPTTHQLVRSPESTTGYDFRPKTENTSDFWHDLWIGFLLIGGALLFFLSIP